MTSRAGVPLKRDNSPNDRYDGNMTVQAMSVRGIQTALALEAAWAVFLGYEIHHRGFGVDGWQLQLLNFIAEWAAPAIAIVVIVWFVDLAMGRLRA